MSLLPLSVVGVSGHRQNLALPWAPGAGWLPKGKGRETGLVLPTNNPSTMLFPGLHHPHQPGQTQQKPDLDQEGANRVSPSTGWRVATPQVLSRNTMCGARIPSFVYVFIQHLFICQLLCPRHFSGWRSMIKTDENSYSRDQNSSHLHAPVLCSALF